MTSMSPFKYRVSGRDVFECHSYFSDCMFINVLSLPFRILLCPYIVPYQLFHFFMVSNQKRSVSYIPSSKVLHPCVLSYSVSVFPWTVPSSPHPRHPDLTSHDPFSLTLVYNRPVTPMWRLPKVVLWFLKRKIRCITPRYPPDIDIFLVQV